MDILILGGTRFIGRHIAETLLKAGHRVTVYNRGLSPDELPAQIERLKGDRDDGLHGVSALAGREWDACIDVSGYTAVQVRFSAEMLRERIGQYVYISAVSVYGDPKERPVDENHPRQPPCAEEITELTAETYGALKVTCEDIIERAYRDRSALLRPQIVVGPHDPSGRYTYWVWRAGQEAEMLAPGDGSDHLQVIDVRDLARFTQTVVERGLGGAFNLAGPRLTWVEFFGILGATKLRWIPAEVIQQAGVTERELPLYRPEHGPRSGLMDISFEKAKTAGLVHTDPSVTISDTLGWLKGTEFTPSLSSDLEGQLLERVRNLTETGR